MAGIAVIDCAGIIGPKDSINEEELARFTQQFGDAMSGIGFAYLINHGVDLSKIHRALEVSREFFQLPKEIKGKYRKSAAHKSFHGYAGPGDELLDEKKSNSTELRELFDTCGEKSLVESGFPSEVPTFKEGVDGMRREVIPLATKLLRCLANYLKLDDEDVFVRKHKNFIDPTIRSHSLIRSLYYAPMKITDDLPPDAIRCGEHSDWGTITLLFQDMIGGLEVKRVTGEWVPATPIKDAVLVNSGQMLEIFSGGNFPATPHRVRIVNDERLLKNPRQSITFVPSPDGDTRVEPLVKKLVSGYKGLSLGFEEEIKDCIAYDHFNQRALKAYY